MIKAFYTAGILMDILEQFGDQPDDIIEKKKYAKWKAAYIHNCLKSGDKPTAGGPDEHLKNVIDISKGDEEESTQNDLVISPHIPNDPGYNLPTGPAPASSPVTPVVPTEPQISTPQLEPVTPSVSTPAVQTNGNPGPEQIQKAQKYCKYATSALNYDDVKTAIENLNKALNLLQFGKE